MKKFLSLVLALIMTMSLVTISAGATEYRDLTDKDEIQYEEAVAVLNRIGVITGYEDGSFRPETELTRGAAAKIIVSLMIGPEAASALPNNASPYPDVPAGHTFAGVIGYCKTAGYISGYGDGTFKPANPLTGYAFAKMLLGAIGYKSDIEGFVDTGWTMNVARIGNVAGLFDRLDFDGAAAVTRDAACQLALNTLKATMVDYGGSNTVVSSTGEVLTVQGSKAQYVTSNNRDINANINRRVINAVNNEMTLEFGEEHFKDLRLEHDKYDPAYDVYGHPSNEWSYKKVTIGTFKLPADFTYTDQIVHREATDASKEKALGLRGYDTWSTDHRNNWANWSTASSGINNFASPFADETQVHINGWHARVNRTTGVPYTDIAGRSNVRPADALTLSEIADLTDNGVTVEVYVCPVDADFITDVVVTRTQLMEIDRVATDYVRLKDIEPDSRDKTLGEITGYNAFAIDATDDNLYSNRRIEDVKDDNYDAYNVLKDLKAGDKVAVIPYTEDDNVSWEVGEAYSPETVSGALTRVDIYNSEAKRDGNAVAITVGGTNYKINEWNKDMMDIKSNDIKATRKDVTLYLAKDGTALWVDEVGNSGEWMIVGDYYQATNDAGKVVWYVHGWTTKGDEVELDLGTIRGAAEKYAPGELVRCQINTANGGGEYVLTKPNNLGASVKKAGMYHTATTDKRTGGAGSALYANYTTPWTATGAGVPSFKENPRATSTTEFDKNWEGIYRVALGYGTNAATGNANDYNIKKSSQYILLDGYGRAHGSVPALADYDGTQISAAERQFVNPTDTVDNPLWGYTWDFQDVDYASSVKFVYVSFDSIGEVESVYFADGKQDVDNAEMRAYNTAWRNVGTNNDDFVATTAEAYVNDDGNVETVVIKTDSADADLSGIRVITKNTGSNNYVKSVGADATETELLKGKWTEREYVQGPDFSENKVGIFDKEYDVGDILIGSERNGIFYAREFHGDTYRGNSLDGFWIKGVSAVKNTLGNTLKDRFDITNSVLYTLDGNTTLKLATDTSATVTNDAIKALLNMNSASNADEIVDRHQEGVILGGSAKIIDVRVGHEGEITKIKDLFDYDLSKVELKVLLNGKATDAGFRGAYVIVILDAPAEAKDGPSKTMNTFSTVEEVNEALQSGNVTINGDWDKSGTLSAAEGTDILRIPAGVKLTIKGAFNATGLRGILFGSSASKLVVEDELTVDGNELVDSNANVEAKDVTINSTFTFSGKMKVDNDLDVLNTKTLTITGTVTVGGNVVSSDGTASSGGAIVVLSTSSLHVTGDIGDGTKQVTVTVGNGSSASKNGLVKVGGALAANAKFVDQNKGTSAPTQDIASVKGKLEMGADSKLTTENFAPTDIKLAKDATIYLEKGTNGSDVVFTDASNKTLTTGNEPAKVVIGAAADQKVSENNKVGAAVTENDGTEAAQAAKVKLSAAAPEGVTVKANGTALTDAFQAVAISDGKITLAVTAPADKVVTYTVKKGEEAVSVDATTKAFEATADTQYTVELTVKTKVTVAIKEPTSLTLGEALPAQKDVTLTVTPAAAQTAGAVEISNIAWKKGAADANAGDTIEAGATYTLTATIAVKSESQDTYSLDGVTTVTKEYKVAAATTPDPGDTNVTTKVALSETAASTYEITKVNGQAYNTTTGVSVASGSTVTVILTAQTAANAEADALKGGTVTASDGKASVTVTCTGSTAGNEKVTAAAAKLEAVTPAPTDKTSLNKIDVSGGKSLYYGDADKTVDDLASLTEVKNSTTAEWDDNNMGSAAAWYVYTPAVEAKNATPVTVTLNFTAIDGTVTISNITAKVS